MDDLKRTKQELVEEIQTLRQAMKLREDRAEMTAIEADMISSAMDAILIIDESQNIVQFNSAAEQVFGYEASQVIGKPVHLLLPEQLRERHSQHIQNFGKTGSSSRNTRDLGTLSGLRADGEIFPVEISIARVARNSRVYYLAILRDASHRTKLDGLLIRQYDSLNSLHQITLDLLGKRDISELLQFIVDEAAQLLDAPYCEILLPENDELVAKAFTEGTPFPAGNRFTREAAPLSWQVLDSGTPAVVKDYSSWEPHNRIFEAHGFHAAISIPILIGEKSVGVLGFARVETGRLFTEEDILSATRFAAIAALAMENSRLYREIEMLATVDELTGIRNRRSLMEVGEREVKRSIRHKRSLAVLMLDADHFKHINDRWGHATGDMVLRGITKQFVNQIRTTDTVGRYQPSEETESIIGRLGGEEFIILLPETTLERALVVAERIRSAVEMMVFYPLLEGQTHSPGIQVTISIGAAALHLEQDSLLDLLNRADQALYTAKQTGRNRACIQI